MFAWIIAKMLWPCITAGLDMTYEYLYCIEAQTGNWSTKRGRRKDDNWLWVGTMLTSNYPPQTQFLAQDWLHRLITSIVSSKQPCLGFSLLFWGTTHKISFDYLTIILNNARVTIDLRQTSNLQNIPWRMQGFSRVRFTWKIVRLSEIVFVN